jgi:group I intron endonuclease
MDRIFRLYRVTNLVNGKIYLGMTSRSVKFRWSQHVQSSLKLKKRSAIAAAISAYGPQSFSVDLVCEVCGFESAANEERSLIKQYNCMAPLGYNLTTGGEKIYGFNLAVDSRRKMSAWQVGKVLSEETKRKIGLGNTGKVFSAEHRKKLSAKLSLRPRTEAFREKLRLARKGKPRPTGLMDRLHAWRVGKPLSEETKRKLSQALKGRAFTPEHLAKIAATKKAKRRQLELSL